MLLAAALAASVFGHHPRGPAAMQRYRLDGWTITVARDTFTGAVSCALRARDMRYGAGSLIFRVAPKGPTQAAVYRIDGGPARPVTAAFHEEAQRGLFPQRGYIDDPAGGEVALPADYMRGAHILYIRARPGLRPRVFDVSRFAAALAGAEAAGCSGAAFPGGAGLATRIAGR